MPEVLQLNRGTQVGPESVHGTVAAAGKSLKMLGLTMGPKVDFKIFPGMGRRFKTTAGLNSNMTVGKLAGKANYTEIVYPLSAQLGAATITTPGGGTLSRKWSWIPPLTGSIDPVSQTFEVGGSVKAQRFPYGICPDTALALVREGDCTFEGVVWGQAFVDGITMTPTPTGLPQIPLLGKHLCYYADNTSAGLGATKLLRVWDAKWSYKNAYNVLWPMDRTQTSFAAHADNPDPKPELILTVEADTAGMGLYADAIANTTKYVRIEAIGDIIEAAIPYSLTIDMACRITAISELKDGMGNTISLDITFTAIEDTAWASGQSVSIAVVNTLTAL